MEFAIETDKSYLKTGLFIEHIKQIEDCITEIESREDSLTKYPKIFVYGREAIQHRNMGFFSDTSIGYYYSRKLLPSTKFTEFPELEKLLRIVNGIFGTSFNGILVNHYSDGNDYISRHSDDEAGIDASGVVAISYGAVRKFRIRDKSTGKIVKDIPTISNQFIHMGGDFQKEFTHEIPIEKKVKGERYSFTFRKHDK
tara:strand:- start:206 stop:799 length:594 start_codon:yes stop_codon:yes gene_type:complete